MSIQITTVTACAYWASALLSGDLSGIDDADDLVAYEEFCAELAEQGLAIIDVARDQDGEPVEARFTWHGHLYGAGVAGTDVLDYVAHHIA